MTNAETTDEEALKKVIPMLRLMKGGKGPPESGGINWLNGLAKGTAFSCKRKDNSEALEVYIIAFKYDRTIVLVDGFHNERRFAVDPEDFCKKCSYWETIGTEEAGTQPIGVEDDTRTIRPSELDNDVDA